MYIKYKETQALSQLNQLNIRLAWKNYQYFTIIDKFDKY
jgi:hypothetical protein